MTTQDTWLQRIDGFHQTGLPFDDAGNEELLHDILQDLFSTSLKEDTKIEMVSFIEQQVDLLVPDSSSSEQTFGSLFNVYKSLDQNVVLLKSQILITMTTISTTVSLYEVNNVLLTQFLEILISNVTKGSRCNLLLVRTSCECLRVIEQFQQGRFEECLVELLASSKNETSFVLTNFLLLLAEIFNNRAQKSSLHDSSGMNSEIASYLIENTSYLSPTGLLQLIPRIASHLERSKVPKTIIVGLLSYCSQSYSLILSLLALYIQSPELGLFPKNNDRLTALTTFNLIKLATCSQLPDMFSTLALGHLIAYLKKLPTNSIQQESSLMAIFHIQPSLQMKLDLMFKQRMFAFSEICSLLPAGTTRANRADALQILFSRSKTTSSTTSRRVLFFGLYCLHKTGDADMQNRILQFVEEFTVFCPDVACNTIGFCDHLKTQYPSSYVSLLKNITARLLVLESINVSSLLILLERVSVIEDICPLSILTKLNSVLLSLDQHTYDVGNKLLSVCKNLLLTHATSTVIYKTACLLWDIHKSYHNNDTQERALFYYLVVGNLSPAQFKQVLSTSRDHRHESNSLVQSPKNYNDLPTLQRFNENMLSFAHIEAGDNDTSASDSFNSTIDSFVSYKTALQHEDYRRHVSHRFELSFVDGVGDVNEIYGIEITLSASNGNFEQVPAVLCPVLKREERGVEFTVDFTPLTPLPAVFSISATFTDDTNRSFIATLTPFRIQFKHLFTPLMRLSSLQTVELFHALWKDIEENQESAHTDSRCALSVKNLLNMSQSALRLEMGQFIVAESEECILIGGHLPPRSHVLLKFRAHESRTVVNIAVDDFTTLKHIDEYLETLKES